MKAPLVGFRILLLLLASCPCAANAAVQGVSLLAPQDNRLHLPIGDSIVTDYTDDGRYVVFLCAAGNVIPGVVPSGYVNVYVCDQIAGSTRLVSVNRDRSRAGEGNSTNARISADGRYVVFESEANDLVWNDDNAAGDVFLHDLQENRTMLISLNAAGIASGNGRSWSPVITPDGACVAFVSAATDLVTDDINGYHDVFVREVTASITTRVSLGPLLPFPYNYQMFESQSPAISADGNRIAFMSWVYNLIPSRRTYEWAIFLRDLEAGQTLWISTNVTQYTAGGVPLNCHNPVLTPDGAWVAFKGDGSRIFQHHVDSATTTLVSSSAVARGLIVEDLSGPDITSDGRFVAYAGGSATGLSQIFRWDSESGQALLVSANPLGNPANGISDTPRISADGRRITFLSHATDLVDGPSSSASQLYFKDVEANVTRRLSFFSSNGELGDQDVVLPWMSGDGGLAIFDIMDTGFAAGDLNRMTDLFEAEVSSGAVSLVLSGPPESDSKTGAGSGSSAVQGMSADGRFILFVSDADDLVAGDSNGSPDVFLRDTVDGTTTLVSVNLSGSGSGNGSSHSPAISADGRYAVFQSTGSDLVLNDTNEQPDIFVRDLQAGHTALVSVNLDATGSAVLGARSPAFGRNGRGVAFISRSPDLVAGEVPEAERVFYRDLLVNQTVVLGRELLEFDGWSRCEQPIVAADGSSVVFQAVTPQQRTLYRAELHAPITLQVDEPLIGAIFTSRDATVSADGRRIAFISNHPSLVPEDANEVDDVFVRDVESGSLWLVSVGTNGIAGNGAAVDAAISADGRWVAFSSAATDLVGGAPPGSTQAYLRDLETHSTLLISREHSADQAAAGISDQVVVSSDGRYVGYRSSADVLTTGDDNGFSDVFLFDRSTGIQALVSAGRARLHSANGPSYRPMLSEDGSVLVFKSYASDLIELDYNNAPDIFLVSSSDPGGPSSLVLTVEILGDGQISLRWRAISSDPFAIEYRDQLSSGDWQPLDVVISIEGDWARAADSLPPGTTERFYRVRYMPPAG